jgi:ABC-type multidrug transport system fused ATPase/permease subunit
MKQTNQLLDAGSPRSTNLNEASVADVDVEMSLAGAEEAEEQEHANTGEPPSPGRPPSVVMFASNVKDDDVEAGEIRGSKSPPRKDSIPIPYIPPAMSRQVSMEIVNRVKRAPSFYPASLGGLQEEEVTSSGRARAFTFSAASPENAPVVLVWKDLTVKTRTNPPTTLLHTISGAITGGFWAIMGSSGGGKTTLLSTISLRLDPAKIDVTGDIHLNGHEYDTGILKNMSAYVLQDDLLHAELTVKETIAYHAELRLAGKMDEGGRKQVCMWAY